MINDGRLCLFEPQPKNIFGCLRTLADKKGFEKHDAPATCFSKPTSITNYSLNINHLQCQQQLLIKN